MSSFSKIYYSPKDASLSLSAKWETGYRNIEIFHEDRLVHRIPHPGVLMKGIQIADEELGKIKFSFTTTRPRKLEIKVNRKKFVTIDKRKLGYDYSGLTSIFSVITFFSLIGLIIFLTVINFDISHPLIMMGFAIEFCILLSYGLTAYFLSKKKPGAYFLGTSVFAITTVIALSNAAQGLNLIFFTLRAGMLIYILTQIGNILKELKKGDPKTSTEELLDDL